MNNRAKRSGTSRSYSRGFSMPELAVSLAIVMVLTAIAIPTLVESFRIYQFNDAAARVADVLRFTRYDAVRRNTTVTTQIQQAKNGIDWNVWTDSNNDTKLDTIEKQVLIAGDVTLLPAAGLPSPKPITDSLGASVPALDSTKSGANGTISFDARGAVTPLKAYVLYLGSATNPEYGYRAVILLPSGGTQVWSAPAGGIWLRIS